MWNVKSSKRDVEQSVTNFWIEIRSIHMRIQNLHTHIHKLCFFNSLSCFVRYASSIYIKFFGVNRGNWQGIKELIATIFASWIPLGKDTLLYTQSNQIFPPRQSVVLLRMLSLANSQVLTFFKFIGTLKE